MESSDSSTSQEKNGDGDDPPHSHPEPTTTTTSCSKPENDPNHSPLDPNPPNSSASFFKSLSTREPSFSTLTFSPSRFSSCTTTPHYNPSPPFQKCRSSSHRCISSTLNKDRQILSIAVSGPLLYTGSETSTIRIWKLPDFSEYGQLKSKKSGAVRALAVSDDRLFAGCADCKIRVWRRSWNGLPTHQRLATIPTFFDYLRNHISGKDQKNTMKHLGAISSLAINAAGDLLYSASVDTTVKVWRISNLKCIETIRAHTEAVNAIVVGEDGVFYSASDDATVKVWRQNPCGSGDRLHSLAVTLPADSSPVKALALTTDGMVLYGGCTDGYVHSWVKGWLSGHMQYSGPLQGHRHAVMCLACVSNYLASGSADLTCRVWIRDEEGLHTCIAILEGHRGPVRCVAAFGGHDGCMVCTASLDGTLKVWRVASSGHVSMGPTHGGQQPLGPPQGSRLSLEL